MFELKGVDSLEKVVNDFLSEFGVTASLGEEFCYYFGEDEIDFALAVGPSHEHFMAHFKQLAPEIECDPFLISLLHELGHHETLYEMDDDEELFCRTAKTHLETELFLTNDKETRKSLHEEYYNLPDESLATQWAIDYIRQNPNKVANFWVAVQAEIFKFYYLNGVKGDN